MGDRDGDCPSYFNPRPPRGGRLFLSASVTLPLNFNPRPPRGGRHKQGGFTWRIFHFNPRPPRGGRLKQIDYGVPYTLISIHAPREGGDRLFGDMPPKTIHFNPRPPRGGRQSSTIGKRKISDYFNPRPPRGGRRVICHSRQQDRGFQSTPPARGATAESLQASAWPQISIHAPREGGDSAFFCGSISSNYFNPRPPRGGRLLTSTGGAA